MSYLYKTIYNFNNPSKNESGSGSYMFELDEKLDVESEEVKNNVKNEIMEIYEYEEVEVLFIELIVENMAENTAENTTEETKNNEESDDNEV